MAISIDWNTRVIYVPQADLIPLGAGVYQLDVDWFRQELKAIEESEEGIAFPDTHRHNTEVNIGGLTLARTVEIINGYTVTFEDGQYAVTLTGANNNVADVTNVNQVSVRSNNSAGMVVVASSEVGQVWESILEDGFTAARILRIIAAAVAGETEIAGDLLAFKNLSKSQNQISGTTTEAGARSDLQYGG